MIKMIKSYIYIIAIIIAFSACSKTNDVKPTETLEKITKIESDDKSLLIELFSDQKIRTGYNPLYIRITDQKSNKELSPASIKIVPMMEMHMESGSMIHSSPVENPNNSLTENGLIKAAVVFGMASDEHGRWTLEVEIKASNSSPIQNVSIPITVLQNKEEKIKTIKLADGTTYMVTYIQPTTPKIGINEFEVVIHQRKSMFEFPAVNDFTITMEPQMPSMGHGSPNNISPVHTNVGHYNGKVNFTMTGLWRLNLDFMSGGAVADTTQFFDIEF